MVTIACCGLLIVAGLVAYANSLDGVFLLDDFGHILTNERIRTLTPFSNLLTTTRPLVTVSLALNYRLDDPSSPADLDPAGFHVFNLLVHLLAGLTLFGLIRRTLRLPSLPRFYQERADALALTVALLWIVHPLTTQSVTYIIQRGESMMGLSYLLTLYALNRRATARRSLGWTVAAVVACACGMASKAVMVTAPVTALLYDRLFLSDSFGQLVRKRWPLYMGLTATWLIPFFTGTTQGVLDATPRDSVSVGFGNPVVKPLDYLSAQPGVILHYLRLCLWPAGQCLDYKWPVPDTASAIYLPAILIVALIAVSLVMLRRQPGLAFLGIWFFLILAPTSSIIPIKDLAFEHRMYLPLAAVITAAVLVVHRLITRNTKQAGRWISIALLIVVTAVLVFLTHRRNEVYRSEIAMWTDVTEERPENARAHDNLGMSLSRAGRLNEALAAYRKAVKLDPKSPQAHANIGKALARKEQYEQAIPHYEKAVSLGSSGTDLRYSLAVAHAAVGRTEEAINGFRHVLSVSPDHPFAGYSLGIALDRVGRPAEAVDSLRAHLERHNRDVDAYFYLGVVLDKLDKREEASASYRSALTVDPNYEPAREALERR